MLWYSKSEVSQEFSRRGGTPATAGKLRVIYTSVYFMSCM